MRKTTQKQYTKIHSKLRDTHVTNSLQTHNPIICAPCTWPMVDQ